MVAIFLCFVIVACINEKTPTEKTRELLLHEPQKASKYLRTRSTEEQVYIITQLSEELPQRIIPLCDILSGAAQKRCARIAHRPHLWTAPVQATNQTYSKEEECAHPHLCLEKKAIQNIHNNDMKGAQETCTQIHMQTWRQECLFHCAEVLLDTDINRYSDTLSFCEQSGTFRDNCVQHGLFTIASHWLENKYSVTEVEEKSKAILAVWEEHNEFEASTRIDQLWAHWMYRHMEHHTIDPQKLPSHLLVHYHNGIALSGVQFAVHLNQDLEQHVQLLQDNQLKTQTKRIGLDPMMNLWTTTPSENIHSYLGYSFRITDHDPSIDLLLATIEAIARLQPPQTSIIVPYTRHHHPKVRETAKRLLLFDLTSPQRYHLPVTIAPEDL